MNKARLLKLADLLEKDAKNKKGINFDYWTTARISNYDEPISCGTSACAMGLAAISDIFKRQGLGYRSNTRPNGEIIFTWKNKTTNFESAAMKLFDISREQAAFLFVPGNTSKNRGAVAEKQVANLIRKFVAGKITPIA